MAERRMFAKTIIDSDAFLDMPLSTQSLYFHLSMRADDDGFINNPKKIQRMIGCCDDDLKLLIAKNFIIPFESGIVVIKHWKIHNYIQKDRYTPTKYVEEKNSLVLKKNGAYTKPNSEIECDCIQECIQDGYKMDTQVRLGKVSIGKDNVVSNETTIESETPFTEYANGNTELLNALNAFEDMRKKIKKPLTETAKKLLVGKLKKLEADGNPPVLVLEQSIMNCWQGVFELKEKPVVETPAQEYRYPKPEDDDGCRIAVPEGATLSDLLRLCGD